jgi:hypothetical protein
MSFRSIRDLDMIPAICAGVAGRGRIEADDVRLLKRHCPRGLPLTLGEAEAIFTVARAKHPACAEWSDYFADVMGVWFVDAYAPDRTPTEAAAQLVGWLGGFQALLDPARIRMLMRVLERLPDCPEDLFGFARGSLIRAMKAQTGGAAPALAPDAVLRRTFRPQQRAVDQIS